MDLYKLLYNAFSFEEMSFQKLIELSSLIDVEKNDVGALYGKTDYLSRIACMVVALMNEKSVSDIGLKLDDDIKNIIVKKNYENVLLDDGEKKYKKLIEGVSSVTYKVKKTFTGYKFDIVASNGEILAVSEVYSSVDTCMNGIKSVKKHIAAMVENQTVDNCQTIHNPKYEVYCDRMGEFRFRLRASNGQILIVSGGYQNEEECLRVIGELKRTSDSNDVEKS